ncbi:unnamed protein product [Adineta ricciae]|uniref:Uncharacterized protein n=1 Tax=Adineta ricciae TaxID=249248 RepID=A0A816EDU4_ADIRI|nr:unnamed protein product [Adineta ricciae]CAF1647751.1 unnamed protein product [Adineta ricciae]
MHYLFTLPYQFHRLDQCIDQNFFTSIQTNLSHSNLNLLSMKFVRHLDLSCHITIEFLDLLRKSFSSLKSIRFSSSTAEYLHPPPLFRQHRYFLHSVRKLEFDLTCRNQILFLCLLPNLTELILHQSLLNIVFEQISSSYFYKIKRLVVYSFQRQFLDNILQSFVQLEYLILKTTKSENEGPQRSYLSNRCHHKSRPVSITDILHELLKSSLRNLKEISIGCYFERDEVNLQGILSRMIEKSVLIKKKYFIQIENFHSTRCGNVQIEFF